jgi:hypothetical protein
VGGALPADEMPKVLGRGKNRYGVARFGLDGDGEGPVILKINETQLMHLFDGEKEIPLPKKGAASIEVPAGGDGERFTVSVNSVYRTAPVLIERVEKK